MKNFWLKALLIWIVSLSSALCYWFAQDDLSFLVELEPTTLNVWEAVDFKVTAMKNWEIFKDYSWDILFYIEWASTNDYTVPWWWLYTFKSTDQWSIVFSKWLTVNRVWSFLFQVSDIKDDSMIWEIAIMVWDSETWQSVSKINIESPTANTKESKNSTIVIWSCSDLKNSPIVVFVNDKQVSSWYTDSKWNFNVFVDGLKTWDNKLQVKIVDINNIVLWESDILTINYTAPEDDFFKSLEILTTDNKKITTNTKLKQWEKIIFNLQTADTVTSAAILFSNGTKFSMDRLSQWSFTKELVTTFYGTLDISLELVEWMDTKDYKNISTIIIEQNTSISNIKFTATGVEWTDVVVSWDTIWDVDKYLVNYGTWKDALSNSITVTSAKILVENLQKDVTYYFQISPLDSDSHTSWDPSEIVEYHAASQPCIVKWINVKTEKIWDNYYLVWDPVENVRRYEVYRSDRADMTDSRKVWDLTWTRFQYLYDENATKDEYAYYQVQAICSDGSNVVIDKAQKVKVWPFENTLLVIIISVFVYSIYRLHKFWEE